MILLHKPDASVRAQAASLADASGLCGEFVHVDLGGPKCEFWAHFCKSISVRGLCKAFDPCTWRGSILAPLGYQRGSRLSRTAPRAVRNREKPCARSSPGSWPTSSDPRHKRLQNTRLRLQSRVPTPLAIELGTQSGGAGGCLRVCVVAQNKPFCSTGITRGASPVSSGPTRDSVPTLGGSIP